MLVTYLNSVKKSCLQLVLTFATLSTCFLAHRSSEFFSFCVFILKANINLRKQFNFLKLHAVFQLIIHMTCKLHSPYGFTQFGLSENFSLWFIPNCTRNAWLPIQIASKIILTNFVLDEWSAHGLSSMSCIGTLLKPLCIDLELRFKISLRWKRSISNDTWSIRTHLTNGYDRLNH